MYKFGITAKCVSDQVASFVSVELAISICSCEKMETIE